MHGSRFAAALGAALALFAAGCSSRAPAPFPADPDPCAAYCPKWVPPVYRSVPKLCVGPSKTCVENVTVKRVEFCETCKPGVCETRCVPDQCRQYGAVEVEPARNEWVQVKCPDPCGCGGECCWKQVRVPPKYKWCPKCETEEGFTYCAFTPPEYDVVPVTVTRCEKVKRYVPPSFKVVWQQDLYEPGHWTWVRRYDCPECPPCPSKPDCAPMGAPCGAPCAPQGPPIRGDFRSCPPGN